MELEMSLSSLAQGVIDGVWVEGKGRFLDSCLEMNVCTGKH